MYQYDLFGVANEASPSRVVKSIDTNLGVFGNRTDLIVVDESTVGEASLIECDNSDVRYFNSASPFDKMDNIDSLEPGGDQGPLDDGKPKT